MHNRKQTDIRRTIELGTASVITRGNGGLHFEAIGLMPKVGIARG